MCPSRLLFLELEEEVVAVVEESSTIGATVSNNNDGAEVTNSVKSSSWLFLDEVDRLFLEDFVESPVLLEPFLLEEDEEVDPFLDIRRRPMVSYR